MAKLACREHFPDKTEEITLGVPGQRPCCVCGKAVVQGEGTWTLRDHEFPADEAPPKVQA